MRSDARRLAAAAATGSGSPAGAGMLSAGGASESVRVMVTSSAGSPIASCTDRWACTAATESSAATFSSCPALTAARRTSSSLTSPTSRRSCAILRRLSASSALRRDRRARARAASARV